MRNYKLTWPRTILFSILLMGGIYYFVQNGFGDMANYEIVLSAVLMVTLLVLVIIKLLDGIRQKS